MPTIDFSNCNIRIILSEKEFQEQEKTVRAKEEYDSDLYEREEILYYDIAASIIEKIELNYGITIDTEPEDMSINSY